MRAPAWNKYSSELTGWSFLCGVTGRHSLKPALISASDAWVYLAALWHRWTWLNLCSSMLLCDRRLRNGKMKEWLNEEPRHHQLTDQANPRNNGRDIFHKNRPRNTKDFSYSRNFSLFFTLKCFFSNILHSPSAFTWMKIVGYTRKKSFMHVACLRHCIVSVKL